MQFSVKELRARKNETQEQVANTIGISPQTYCSWEKDISNVASIPKIEVHISNVHTREEFRHTSVTVPVCNGQVVGLGLKGYLYAMEAVVDMAECKAKE